MKSKQVFGRVSDETFRVLEQRAKDAGQTVSEHVRSVLETAVSGDVSHTLKQLLSTKYCVLRLAEKQYGEQVAAQIRDVAKADAEQALSLLGGGK